VANLAGHFSQILGDSAEDDFYALARAIGYGIIRYRNPRPGIDFVADFSGKTIENCFLLRPTHSPEGLTAFSVKSGDATSADVTELLDYVKECQESKDPTLSKIRGGVLVVGTAKTRDQINTLLSKGVFCWDVKRLIFYSMKAKTVYRLSEKGRVNEYHLGEGISGGFVLSLEKASKSLFAAEVHVYVDDHNLVLQGDHMGTILDQVYATGLSPIIRSTGYDIEIRMFLNALGPIQRKVVDEAYSRYYATGNDPGLMTPAIAGLEMQSYVTSPWTAIFRS
jgi:hypothetical protein